MKNDINKEVTIYDIAKKLKISTTTVSRALKDHPTISKKTRKKINDTAKALGYRRNHFASNLRRQRTNTIGVILHELSSNFITTALAGIEKVASEAGYDLIIVHSSEQFQKEIANAQNLFHKRVDGLIASLAFDTKDLDHFKQFEDKGIPIIFFDRVEENSRYPKVIIDNFKSGYEATRHLIEQGCKRIVLLTANLLRNVYAQRHKGYITALNEAGISVQDEYILIKDLTERSGMDAALQVLNMNPMPDGAFITNDFSAAVFMHTIKEHGVRVPEDFAIVGFNNDAICKIVDPQLTTINYPGVNIGEIAARNLINHLNKVADINSTNTIVVRSELIIRKSSLMKSPQVVS